MMLDAVPVEDGHRSVVSVDRTGDGNRPFGQENALTLVRADIKMVGDMIELAARHFEDWPSGDTALRIGIPAFSNGGMR
jgi:hypothetical protein